uniref:Type II secretion system protein GspG C-terminal domain-containing protein n=1 Tax=uncultured Armatimonadetes bacterium TaxID=157466 RepID=A0A6J4JSP8_9BACT|nr:hypothetical protein AVDCRST_MAG63-3995 [uncultured Armatimonadetes bacterium]
MATGPKKLHWTRGEKALFAASGAVVLLGVLGLVGWQIVNADPFVNVPTPTLPNPNAFESFVRAGDALVEGPEIRRALAADDGVPRGAALPLAQKERLVQANALALATLREGFAHPFHEPPARSFSHVFPHYTRFRDLGRILALEGEAKAGRGDPGGALDSYLDCVYLGQEVPRGGTLIGKLVGLAIVSIGRQPAWEVVPRLDARQARAGAARIETISARHVSFADALQEESWGTQAGLAEALRKDGARGLLNTFEGGLRNPDAGGPIPHTVLPSHLRLVFTSKRKILNNYVRFMDQQIANAREPFAARLPEPELPDDPVNQLLAPVFGQARVKDVNSEVQNALLTVALALRAYRAERGRYPERLAELAPEYLKSVPVDPFALEGPLRYRRTATGYVLYSVGPDGKDDGGKPIEDAEIGRDRPGRRYAVQGGSRGDIVAGVNIY